MINFLSSSQPKIHQAIVDNNVPRVKELAQDASLNEWGYLPFEMAILLGRMECVDILFPRPHKRFYLVSDKKREVLSEDQWKKKFQVHSCPTLCFPDFKTFTRAAGSCSRLFCEDPDGEEFRRLGRKYRRHFFFGWFAPVSIRWIDKKMGYGLFAEEDLEEGDYIGEYAGLLRQINRLNPVLNEYCIRYPLLWPIFRYYVVDSHSFGNESRFINHSDDPNLEPKLLVDRSLLHTGFFAVRPIKKGEQLTFNYGKDFWRSRHSE